MKKNYSDLLEEKLNKLNSNASVPKLLLHSCCAPCSSYVIDYLSKYFCITIFYYNPNIFPREEYLKRKEEQIRLIREMSCVNKVDVLDCDYDNDVYEAEISGLEKEPEKGKRCNICFKLRLSKTAAKAKSFNYDYFGTTLTVSPYKNSNLINEIGLELQNVYGINYLVSDFKKKDGYKKSIELSKEYNLYRQNYCGCKYSKRD